MMTDLTIGKRDIEIYLSHTTDRFSPEDRDAAFDGLLEIAGRESLLGLQRLVEAQQSYWKDLENGRLPVDAVRSLQDLEQTAEGPEAKAYLAVKTACALRPMVHSEIGGASEALEALGINVSAEEYRGTKFNEAFQVISGTNGNISESLGTAAAIAPLGDETFNKVAAHTIAAIANEARETDPEKSYAALKNVIENIAPGWNRGVIFAAENRFTAADYEVAEALFKRVLANIATDAEITKIEPALEAGKISDMVRDGFAEKTKNPALAKRVIEYAVNPEKAMGLDRTGNHAYLAATTREPEREQGAALGV